MPAPAHGHCLQVAGCALSTSHWLDTGPAQLHGSCRYATDLTVCILQDVLPHDVPIISVSKGLEVGTGKTMSELIVDVLGRKHPCCFLSGPSFAKEVMTLQPTGVVAASKVSYACVLILSYGRKEVVTFQLTEGPYP